MLNKVAGILRQDTAVGYYRIGQVVMFLDKITKYKCRITPFTGRNQPKTIGETWEQGQAWNDKLLMAIAGGSDVILTNTIIDDDEILKIMDLRKWSGAKWVVDIDDNLYAASNDNPGQGVRKARANIERCFKMVDGVIVSVPALKELYSKFNDNIYVNPNGIDFSWFKAKPKKHKGIRIGWRGAYGHKADLELVKPAIKKLKEKYDVTFVTFGAEHDYYDEHHKWVPFIHNPDEPKQLSYTEKLADMNLDIAVVPLVDSAYNRCKSNLAILEFSALKVPVVASPTENQKNMPIGYAKTNFEWYEELEKLIKDKELRQKQGQEQNKFVRKNYDMKGLTKPLAEWLEQLPRKKH